MRRTAYLCLTITALALSALVATMIPDAPSTALSAITPAAAQPSGAMTQPPGAITKSPFGVPVKTAPPQEEVRSASEIGPVAAAWGWLMRQQQAVNQQLAQAVRNFKTMDPLSAALILASLSFTYGVLHAAGPGHGKAVISSYVLANRETVRRGILLSFIASVFQALSAILIVGVLAILLNQTGIEIKAAESSIETASWFLVAAIGIWLLISQIRKLAVARSTPRSTPRSATSSATAAATAGPADHVHAADCSHHAHNHNAHHGHGNAHALGRDHGHEKADSPVACSCGHAHMPSPEQLAGEWSWPKAIAIALAVGIRPCTGAIIVMVFALTQGLIWAGVFATFAMAIGTAITVSTLAALAVGSRELAERIAFLSGGSNAWPGRIQATVGILGALLVTLFGVTFFLASLSPQAPF